MAPSRTRPWWTGRPTSSTRIIADERAAGGQVGDHFAKAGANDRVWNALEKLAVRDPETFVDYYANDIVALVSRAWLGPGYQVTSQVNVVRPGGQAQDPHRDYHLGFLENDVVERYPTHVHLLSPVLTLQGAVAHSDMPVESGPTMYLPYSHQFVPGYLAWRLPEFREHFAQNYVQLPLAKGDAVFFNPALFHGAGTNVSADIQRVANLLQVSSAFGRAMEAVDRDLVTLSVYPVLLDRKSNGSRGVRSAATRWPRPPRATRSPPTSTSTSPSTGSPRVAGRDRPRRPRGRHHARRPGGAVGRLRGSAYDVAPARIVRTVSQDNPGARAADRSELSGYRGPHRHPHALAALGAEARGVEDRERPDPFGTPAPAAVPSPRTAAANAV